MKKPEWAQVTANQRGHRYEMARELEDLAKGWSLRGNDAKADEHLKGATELRDGAPEVTVGHFRYIVKD